MRQLRQLGIAFLELYRDSGFSMAGAVSYSFVLALFPFSIFLGALAGVFGGRTLASQAVDQLFHMLPDPVAGALAPEVFAVMSQSRYDLVTIGAAIALFFATSAIESLRAALNVAYRVKEQRSYLWCLMQSSLFVFVSAIGALVLAWGVLFAPGFASELLPWRYRWVPYDTSIGLVTRYAIVIVVIGLQLFAYHLWLAAGRRRIREVLPGVVFSGVLWILTAQVYGSYLQVANYARFYAGLTQLMAALVFFQLTAIIIILGAELNRGIMEMRRRIAAGDFALNP